MCYLPHRVEFEKKNGWKNDPEQVRLVAEELGPKVSTEKRQ